MNLEFLFTNGHAVNSFSSQYTSASINNISSIVDWKAVRAKYWNDENDLDLKRRKEAEFLVLGDIPINAILGYVVYNENTKDSLISYGIDIANIIIKTSFYF